MEDRSPHTIFPALFGVFLILMAVCSIATAARSYTAEDIYRLKHNGYPFCLFWINSCILVLHVSFCSLSLQLEQCELPVFVSLVRLNEAIFNLPEEETMGENLAMGQTSVMST